LAHGAAAVVALDVGTAQLAQELRDDARVTSVERTHVKDFRQTSGAPPFDWVVCDVSFIGLARIVPELLRLAPGPDARFLLLVKPQFELPSSAVPAGGVVEDAAARERAVELVKESFEKEASGIEIDGGGFRFRQVESR